MKLGKDLEGFAFVVLVWQSRNSLFKFLERVQVSEQSESEIIACLGMLRARLVSCSRIGGFSTSGFTPKARVFAWRILTIDWSSLAVRSH